MAAAARYRPYSVLKFQTEILYGFLGPQQNADHSAVQFLTHVSAAFLRSLVFGPFEETWLGTQLLTEALFELAQRPSPPTRNLLFFLSELDVHKSCPG